ncbi:MAG: Oxidoreductase protein family [Nitrosarchaeum sp.]|nr:Oxidoreductase protein family [Nitrosarchaeum sp.]
MNVAVIGLGKMGLLHAGILNSLKDVNLIAITEKEKLISNYIKSSLDNVKVYEDYEKMFESENIDLAYITTPVSTHVPIALACINNKISFFMEKPISGNFNETKKLCSELKKSNIQHYVGFNRRFIDTFVKVKSLLDLKVLGQIDTVKSTMYAANVFSKPKGWRSNKKISGGGVLLDFGSHVIDLLHWYFGDIKDVSAKIRSIYSEDVEDEAEVQFNFVNNIKGSLSTSWSKKGYRLPEITLEINGDNGQIIVNEDCIKIALKKLVPGLEKQEDTIYKQTFCTGVPIDIGGADYTKEDIHVISAFTNNKQSLVNVFEASKVQSVIHYAYESVKSNSFLKVKYIE